MYKQIPMHQKQMKTLTKIGLYSMLTSNDFVEMFENEI